jgi:hypothetical protein
MHTSSAGHIAVKYIPANLLHFGPLEFCRLPFPLQPATTADPETYALRCQS